MHDENNELLDCYALADLSADHVPLTQPHFGAVLRPDASLSRSGSACNLFAGVAANLRPISTAWPPNATGAPPRKLHEMKKPRL